MSRQREKKRDLEYKLWISWILIYEFLEYKLWLTRISFSPSTDKAPSESDDLDCDHISRQIELRGSLTTNGEGKWSKKLPFLTLIFYPLIIYLVSSWIFFSPFFTVVIHVFISIDHKDVQSNVSQSSDCILRSYSYITSYLYLYHRKLCTLQHRYYR